VAAGLCAGCGTLAAAVLGNKRLACVAVVDVGVLPSIACIILHVGGVVTQLQSGFIACCSCQPVVFASVHCCNHVLW